MDFDNIVDIVSRIVSDYLKNNNNYCKVLMISQRECKDNFLFSSLPSCSIDNTFDLGYNLDLDKYEFLMIDSLDIKDIFKIANAICDTDYLSIICKAILSGKKLYVLKNRVEIFSYKNTSSTYYYKNIINNLSIIEKSGVNIVSNDEMYKLISSRVKDLNNIDTKNKDIYSNEVFDMSFKRLITQLDIEKLDSNIKAINVSKNCIITALANDICRDRYIYISRV